MARSDDTDQLAAHLDGLKERLDAVNFVDLKTEEEVETYIVEISDAYVQLKQYISRHGENAWQGWGPARWAYLERSKVALENRLLNVRRTNERTLRRFDRKISFWSVVFVAISAMAAGFSAYFSYKAIQSAQPHSEKTEMIMPSIEENQPRIDSPSSLENADDTESTAEGSDPDLDDEPETEGD